jgi:uncharacterized protein (DUF2225 family)
MKSNDSPVYLSQWECPVCGGKNEHKTLRMGAYMEEGRDTDFCPKKRTWKNPNYQKYNPLLFFMATCAGCHFTKEFTTKFKDWKNDMGFKGYKQKPLKEKHQNELKRKKNIIKLLGENLDDDKYPFQTAVNKLLLGIYDEKFNMKFSNLDLGRYFLRIGWLFRENSDTDNLTGNLLASHAMKIEDLIYRLGSQYEQVNSNTKELQTSITNFLNDSSFPDGDHRATLMDQYNKALEEMKVALEHQKSAVVAFKGSLGISGEVLNVHTDSASPLDQPFMSYDSYRNFLREAKSMWEEVPLSEQEALNSAAKYYKNAYEEGNEISKGNQAIQAVYLIAELSRRIGKNEEAKGYFNTAIKLAQEYIHQNKGDKSRTALARKIFEMAMEQGKLNLQEVEQTSNEPA